jgi:molybdopterin-synthase adenylyltransferase
MRYARQELLKEIGKQGQQKLSKAKVAIVGIGALGTATASLLARGGVNHLTLMDRDIIELHNLQRQHLFTEADRHKPKATEAMMHLKKINSTIQIEANTNELNNETRNNLKGHDLILDCTDNFATRFLINDFCVKNNIPWIYAAAIGTKGRVLVMTPKTACFRCIFPVPKPGSLETCDTAGVLNTITTTIAAIQSTEAIKLLTKQPYTRGMMCYDIWKQDFTKIKVKKKDNCVCCVQKQFDYLNNTTNITTKLCGQGRVQVKGDSPDFTRLKKRLKQHGTVKISKYGLLFEGKETNFFLFKDGRCLIKANTVKKGKNLYSKYVGN